MADIARMYYNEILHKTANENAITHLLRPCSNQNCNTQIIG